MTTLPPSCAECLVIWSLNRPEPSGPHRPVIGITLPFTSIYITQFSSEWQLAPFYKIRSIFICEIHETLKHKIETSGRKCGSSELHCICYSETYWLFTATILPSKCPLVLLIKEARRWKREWGTSAVTRIEENWNTRRKSCPSATWSAINPI